MELILIGKPVHTAGCDAGFLLRLVFVGRQRDGGGVLRLLL